MSMFNLAISCLLFSRLVVSNSLQLYGLQHTRLPYLLPSPEICSNLCTLSQWCHPTILCCPLLFLTPIPPSIRVFSNESTLRVRWPKYWSFSFSISPSNEHPGLISFRMDWLDLLAVQGTLKSLLQHHSSKASIGSSQIEMAGMNIDILGISELKCTGMGEFNSDDHYIYYCGQ